VFKERKAAIQILFAESKKLLFIKVFSANNLSSTFKNKDKAFPPLPANLQENIVLSFVFLT
jgi:hypothetical protein